MNYVRLCGRVLFGAIFVASMTLGVTAQYRTGGDVVDVIDGKTVVLSVPTGLVTVELQYIDVPEVGQSMHDAMTQHVRTLLVGKAVELHTRGMSQGKISGKLVLNGIDVSQQLLRNGAAWHLAMDRSGQNKAEFAAYAESETLARLEKRGVWSVAGLEPAWQFREKKRAAEMPPPPPPRRAVVEAEPNATGAKRKSYWSDVNPRLKNVGGLSHGFNAATKTGYLGMTVFGVTEEKTAAPGQKTAIDITYFYTENGEKGRSGYFQVRVLSLSKENWRFLKSNTLSFEIDGKPYVVGKAKREAVETKDDLTETLIWRVDVGTVEKFAHGGEVKVKIADYVISPKPVVQILLYNLLNNAK
jgi:endonuclease YncB( thermonuclease family)